MNPSTFSQIASKVGIINRNKLAKTRRIRNIQTIGDSIIAYQGAFGLSFAAPVNLLNAVELRGAGITCPTGNGTIAWDLAAKTLTWTAPGDTAGAPVVITGDGHYDLPSSTAANSMHVGVVWRLLSVLATTSDTLASSTRYWRRGRGSIAHVIDAMTNGRFNILRDMGLSGCYSADVLGRYPGALAAVGPNGVIIDESGTNDEVAGNGAISPATVVSNRAAGWDMAASFGVPVIAFMIAPRFATNAAYPKASGDTNYSASRLANMVATNRLLIQSAATRSNVALVDNWTPMVDPASTSGRVRDYCTDDGLHPAGDYAIEHAIPAVRHLNVWSPDNRANVNVGGGSYYDATYNLGGNLLASNLGAFVGTSATPGTGASLTAAWVASTTVAVANVTHVISNGSLYRAVSAGTAGTVAPAHLSGVVSDGVVSWLWLATGVVAGLAIGWSIQRSQGSAVVASCHKLVATDGGPDWQEFVITGATANETSATAEEFKFFPTALSGVLNTSGTLARLAVGDIIDTSVQMQIVDGANNCYGVYMSNVYTGGLAITHDSNFLKDCYRGIRITEPFKLALEPIPIFTGITNLQPLFFIQSKAGGVFRVRVRNADLHKVV